MFREVSLGKSVLIIVFIGFGKIEVVVLFVFNEIFEEGLKLIFVFYIVLLKVFNRDFFERFEWWGKKFGIIVEVCYGDILVYRKVK